MLVINLTSFSEFVHKLRDGKKMNTRDFANFCNVSQSTIVRAENFQHDHSTFRLESLRNIAEANGHSLRTLIGYIYPDEAEIDPDTLAAAETFGQLSTQDRESISASIDGILRKRREVKK